ncbi:FAD-dependent oxidoreductase [Cohnella sp.]|uniref:FAD-dependent oxidoreductase n=1 Tax=Cohnella sp. TaxID=1883426 RepID=UPI00356AE1DB
MSVGKAVIAGCGIAGPAAALALQKIGMEATIYEAYETAAHDVGSFMTLATNGLDGLRTLGVHEAVTAIGTPTQKMALFSGSGKRLGEIGNGVELPDGTVNHTIKRAELYSVLADEAQRRGIRIEYGKRLIDVEQRPNGVVAKFADGSEAEGSLIIGADGVHSRVRQLVDRNAPKPRYVGLVGTGGQASGLELAPMPNEFYMAFGKRAFWGHFVRGDGTVLWFANLPWANEPSREELRALSPGEWKRRLLDLFREDRTPAHRILAATEDFDAPMPIYDMDPPENWHRGRIVLIGDAAHVTSPSSGQGASLAIEDALILAQCLRDRAELSQAFAAYQQLRHERVRKTLKSARRINNSKAAGPIGRAVRDALFPIVLRLASKSMENPWLHHYHIDFERPIDETV